MILSKHDVQHALLAMRGPGAIIGDDSLRCGKEQQLRDGLCRSRALLNLLCSDPLLYLVCRRDRYMAVSAIAKTPVRTMMITMQKFKLCVDILTLNRISNFRPQFTEGEQRLVKVRESSSVGVAYRLLC